MPFTIEIEEPAVTNPALLPKIQFAVTVSEKVTQSTSTNFYQRLVNVELAITGIKKELLQATVERVFSTIQSSVISDINPQSNQYQIAETLQLEGKANFYVSVDKSNPQALVNLLVNIENVKQSSIDEVLNRLKTYIFASVASDLNP